MADATPGSGAPSSNRNVMILLSYLWLLALVPLLVEKDDKEVQWHAKHGIVLMVAELIFWVAFNAVIVIARAVLGCLVASSVAAHRPRPDRAAHRRDHEGHQRTALDHPRHQPVHGQVLRRVAEAEGSPICEPRCSSCAARRDRCFDRPPASTSGARAPPSPASTPTRRPCRRSTTRMGVQCRFTPTCSVYGEAVVRRFGVVRGGWMAIETGLRCGPWTPAGTRDNPPQ